MAEEWSHSPEAYSNARSNLYAKNRDFLESALAEFKATERNEHGVYGSLNLEAYERELLIARQHRAHDILADAVWELMEELKTCDNGGFNAWACPHGCHTVSFGDKGNPFPE